MHKSNRRSRTRPFEALEVRRLLAADSLLISEFVARNTSSFVDQFEERSDWIELYNPTQDSIAVSGWHLTDDVQDLAKWPLPDVSIPAKSFQIVFSSGRNLNDPAAPLHSNFRLNRSGEYLGLVAPDGTVAHEFAPTYPEQFPDISYGVTFEGEVAMPTQFRYFAEPTPEAPNGLGRLGLADSVSFDIEHGFFDAPILVQLSTTTPGAEIRYSTDGSVPTADTGKSYEGPLQVDRTSVLRAVAIRTDLIDSRPTTASYLFPGDIVRQDTETALAAGLSTEWGRSRLSPGNNQPDFDMDPDVVNDPSLDVTESLRSLPTVSLVAAGDDLFGNQGIYFHPSRRGTDWERETSVEIIYPDGRPGIQVNAGLRIQGAFSRTHAKKNGLRLVFKEEFGPTELEFPLYGADRVDRFNTLVLRAGFNDSWYSNIGPAEAQYTRDEYNLAVQRAMGHETIQSSFMHVYLNGIYWGVYNVVERPDAAFAAEHFGGQPEDWDSINHNGVEDGDDVAWNRMLELVQDPTPEGFLRLQGIDSDDAMAEAYLDIDNFIDYVLTNIYTGNTDWPHKNWYAARRRGPESTGFRFFSWDAELSVNLANWSSVDTDNTQLCGTPQGTRCEDLYLIYDALRRNPEFRLRLADRAHKHFFHGGTLYVDPDAPAWNPATPDTNRPAALYVAVNEAIQSALPAESARWGDAIRSDSMSPYRPDVQWQAEYETQLNEYFPVRTSTVLAQLKSPRPTSHGRTDPLYPLLAAPKFQINGTTQHGGYIDTADQLTIAQDNQQTVYFTTNGTDPRLLGGEINPHAIRYNTQELIGPTSNIRFLLPDGSEDETNWTLLTFDDSTWNTGRASLGFETNQAEDVIQVPGGFHVLHRHSTEPFINGWEDVNALFDGSNIESEAIVEGVPSINYHDRGRDGHFDNNAEWPAGSGNDHATMATGKVFVQHDGTYSFGITSNDASRLRINGQDIIFEPDRHPTKDTITSVDLTAGEHDIELTTFNRRGSATVELYAAVGQKDAFDESFQLLGNISHRSFENEILTELPSPDRLNSASVYTRLPFSVEDTENIDLLTLQVQYDDGYVAYLNGTEISRRQAPETLDHQASATGIRDDREALQIEQIDISEFRAHLRAGENILAIHALNSSANDVDMLLVPRLVATVLPSPIPLNSTTRLKSRSYDRGEWSALNEAIFRTSVPPTSDALRISEIHYHPADPTDQEIAAGFEDADDFEFIEIVNVSGDTVDLSSVAFISTEFEGDTTGVRFEFSAGDVRELPAGERVVVVEDLDAFRFRYDDVANLAGQWSGRLSNRSETITLETNGTLLQQFRYLDEWHPQTDGQGPSLTIIDATDQVLANWNRATSWRPSSLQHGTPGRDDSRVLGDSNGDGVFSRADLTFVFAAGEYDDEIENNSTFETGDWNNDGEFDSEDIVFAFIHGGFNA